MTDTNPGMADANERESPMLTAGEIAEKLHLSVKTVRKLAREGFIPSWKFGSALRFRWTDILEAGVFEFERRSDND